MVFILFLGVEFVTMWCPKVAELILEQRTPGTEGEGVEGVSV